MDPSFSCKQKKQLAELVAASVSKSALQSQCIVQWQIMLDVLLGRNRSV